MMKRRDFLKAASAATVLPLSHISSFADDDGRPQRVMTVAGETNADQLGKMLPHEHVMVDFVGADRGRGFPGAEFADCHLRGVWTSLTM